MPLSNHARYDTVNRLICAQEATGAIGSACNTGTAAWIQKFGYDRWGNRTLLTGSTPPAYNQVTPQATPPATLGQTVVGPFTGNQWTQATYDAGGNMITNSTVTTASTATYDAEGRVQTITGLPAGVLRYYYDGNGNRVMKVICSSSPCTNTTSGAAISTYVYDAMNHLAVEYGPSAPVRGTQYLFADHLGTTRMMVGANGSATHCYDFFPFGEELGTSVGTRGSCYEALSYPATASQESTSVKFTGKERDAETGVDFFGARYMSSAQGRWTSPDRLNITDHKLSVPSTLNKYVYGANNPLKYVDPDGKDITIFYESPSFFSAGHILFTAENEQNGDAAVMSFGPIRDGFGDAERTLGGLPQISTSEFGLAGATADQLRQQYSALTIQTTPEEAQQVIDWIKQHGGVEALAGGYMLYDQNCTTVCRDALKMVNKLAQGNKDWTPTGLWKTLFSKYTHPYWQNNFGWVGNTPGVDYGQPRREYDPFRLLDILSNCTYATETWNDKTNTLTAYCH